MNLDIFCPFATGTLTTGAASASVKLGQGSILRVYNTGANIVYIRWGGLGTVATDVTDVGIAPGTVEMFNISQLPYSIGNSPVANPSGVIYLAGISTAGASAINWQTGEGA